MYLFQSAQSKLAFKRFDRLDKVFYVFDMSFQKK